jgi:type III secretion protein U
VSGEKNLDPTEHKLKEAREKGDVPTSPDLIKSGVCLVGFEACHALGQNYHDFVSAYFQDFVRQVGSIRDFEHFHADNVFVWIIGSSLVSLLIGGTSVLGFIVMSWLQTSGPIFKKTPIEFKLDSLLPQNYFQKIFSSKTLVDVGGNLVKAALLSVTLWFALKETVRQLPVAIPAGIEEVSALMGRETLGAVRLALVLLFVLSVGDFWIQRSLSRKKLKMSTQDMKDEHKQTEGNPESKHNIRSFAQELLSGSDDSSNKLKGANVLVVNPTHVAVGLRYVHGAKQLPSIRSSAVENEARELIELARDLGVPVVRHIWLARTLYNVPPGEPIPREAYRAIAAVFRMILALEGMPGAGEGAATSEPTASSPSPPPASPPAEDARPAAPGT